MTEIFTVRRTDDHLDIATCTDAYQANLIVKALNKVCGGALYYVHKVES